MAYFISRCKIITKTQAFRLKLFVLYGFSYNSPNWTYLDFSGTNL